MLYDGNNALEEIGVSFLPDECEFISSETNSFIDNVKERNLLPLEKLKIHYSNNFWDFSIYKATNIADVQFRFNFSTVASCYRDDIKNYVLINIIESRHKITVIKSRFYNISHFLNYCSELGIVSLDLITSDLVKEWIALYPDITARTMDLKISAIVAFCQCYDANFRKTFSTTFYNELHNFIDSKLLVAESINGKTPDIPQEFFNQTLSAAIKTINDTSAPTYFRALSCMLLMESQVGLRSGELFELRVGCVHTIQTNSGEKAYYLEYRTWKRDSCTRTSSTEISYVNEMFMLGYNAILEISKNKREELNTDYLFVERFGGRATNIPIDPSKVRNHILLLFEYYNKYFQTVFTSEQNVADLFCYKKKRKSGDIYIVAPKMTQFRVHVCTELYETGVPLQYIEKFMSHLSASMAGYYIRPKKSIQENYYESVKVLRGIVTKEALPIGNDKGLAENIERFIKSNNFSVEKDLDAICEKLAETIPIRVKVGGVCIKSSKFRECSKDARTDEFYCAYGVCPNLFTFYYMIDVSYSKACDLLEAIKINKDRGHKKQVQKNINMLQTIIKNELVPQIEELKLKIQSQGVNKVLSKHPQVTPFVSNLTKIEQEIEEWKHLTA